MSSGHRHATDREDWTLLAECPYNGRPEPIMIELGLDEPPDDAHHLTLEAEATNAAISPEEAFPIEECTVCGAPLEFTSEREPTEVLE